MAVCECCGRAWLTYKNCGQAWKEAVCTTMVGGPTCKQQWMAGRTNVQTTKLMQEVKGMMGKGSVVANHWPTAITLKNKAITKLVDVD